MTVNILDGVKKVILQVRLRVNRFDGGRISQPEIDVNHLDPQPQQPKPAQDGLNMPTIPLFQTNRKDQAAVFVPNGQFPTFGAGGFVLVQM